MTKSSQPNDKVGLRLKLPEPFFVAAPHLGEVRVEPFVTSIDVQLRKQLPDIARSSDDEIVRAYAAVAVRIPEASGAFRPLTGEEQAALGPDDLEAIAAGYCATGQAMKLNPALPPLARMADDLRIQRVRADESMRQIRKQIDDAVSGSTIDLVKQTTWIAEQLKSYTSGPKTILEDAFPQIRPIGPLDVLKDELRKVGGVVDIFGDTNRLPPLDPAPSRITLPEMDFPAPEEAVVGRAAAALERMEVRVERMLEIAELAGKLQEKLTETVLNAALEMQMKEAKDTKNFKRGLWVAIGSLIASVLVGGIASVIAWMAYQNDLRSNAEAETKGVAERMREVQFETKRMKLLESIRDEIRSQGDQYAGLRHVHGPPWKIPDYTPREPQ